MPHGVSSHSIERFTTSEHHPTLPPPPFSGSILSRLDCSQTPFFFVKIVWIGGGERVGFIAVGGRRRGRGTSSQTVPHPLSRFDTYPRWSPVTQSARYQRSYGKMRDCEQYTFSLIHFLQIVVVLYFCTSTDPNGFRVMCTMRSVSMWGSSLGCERDQIGLHTSSSLSAR